MAVYWYRVYDNSVLGKIYFVLFDFRMNIITQYNEEGVAYGIILLFQLLTIRRHFEESCSWWTYSEFFHNFKFALLTFKDSSSRKT